MKTSFIIYCRAVGLYALLTLPVIISPETYLISLMYALLYGWFAWAVFTVLSLIIDRLVFDFVIKLFSLFMAVVVAVAFAYEMIGVLAIGEDVWHTLLVIFPFAAVIAGWISICMSRETIRNSCMAPGQGDMTA